MTVTAPLTGPEYDKLVIHRASRLLSPSDPELVTHLVLSLSQRQSADVAPTQFYRGIRLGVPTTEILPTDTDAVTAQRDMLEALRLRGFPLIALLAQLPGQPLLFACAVEGVASTQEEATGRADNAWDKLSTQMLGAHNRFILPISVTQLDALEKANAAWEHISMVRGHPDPSTAHQLESFLNATKEGFVFTLLAQPLNLATMALVRQIAKRDLEFGMLGLDLEDQLRRANEGLEQGALLYQMFALTPSAQTSEAVAEKFLDAFWTSNSPHMLRAVKSSGESETSRLRSHAASFTSDLRPGLDPLSVECFEFSSYITTNELAALMHPTV